jgi:hypothetical protein
MKLEDEEVQALLLPVVDWQKLRHARAECTVVSRALERNQELKIRTRQIVTGAKLAGDALVDVGRTGRDPLSSAAVRGRAGAGVDDGHHGGFSFQLGCGPGEPSSKGPPGCMVVSGAERGEPRHAVRAGWLPATRLRRNTPRPPPWK